MQKQKIMKKFDKIITMVEKEKLFLRDEFSFRQMLKDSNLSYREFKMWLKREFGISIKELIGIYKKEDVLE